MTGSEHGGALPGHPTAEPAERAAFPPADQVLRGIIFALVSGLVAVGSLTAVRRMGLTAAPLAALGACASGLAAWASVIHLTGGERFDDHPFI